MSLFVRERPLNVCGRRQLDLDLNGWKAHGGTVRCDACKTVGSTAAVVVASPWSGC